MQSSFDLASSQTMQSCPSAQLSLAWQLAASAGVARSTPHNATMQVRAMVLVLQYGMCIYMPMCMIEQEFFLIVAAV